MSIAARDPRTPWYAKALLFFVVAHTLSPIDLIPDFIPILGQLDDLLIAPGGLWLAVRLVPPEVLADARARAESRGSGGAGSAGRLGAAIVIFLWILVCTGMVYLLLRMTNRI